MSVKTSVPPVSPTATRGKSSEAELEPISQNVDAILAFYSREDHKISRSQRVLEIISGFAGRPVFPGFILLFVAFWILANILARPLGWVAFDPPPFVWLQGILSLGAFLAATVVLIEQNRLAKLEKLRAQLDLQMNLLSEQKISKLIDLIEELRRDLPMVKDRHDPQAAVLQQPTDLNAVLAVMDERRETQGLKGAKETEENP